MTHPEQGVSVGVPVYNGAKTLRRAVECILEQTHPVVRIHISDNASTDGTAEVCQELLKEHANITYTRQPATTRPADNFRPVLKQASTEYFMWVAADDEVHPEFVERTFAVLDKDPSLVACAVQVKFVAPDGTERLAAGTYPLSGDVVTNLATYLSKPTDNSRLYALYRTAALQQAFPPKSFHAYDWAVSAGSLLHGKHAELEQVLLERDETPSSSYQDQVRQDNPPGLSRIFPLLPMTADLLFRQKLPWRPSILGALLALNLELHVHYMSHHHPGYMQVTGPLWSLWRRHIAWRLKTKAGRDG